jgi:glycosyltransferase involved in cell wall biosynthesis
MDVFEAHPGAAESPLLGWAATVDLAHHDGDFVTLTASVLLGPRKRSEEQRGRPPMHRDARVLPMTSITCRTTPAMARLSDPGQLGPGWQRWGGVADLPSGVARVEMLIDGADAGLARIALPGQYDGVRRSAESLIGRFEITSAIPEGRPTVRLGARVVGIDGEVAFAPEIDVHVSGRRVDPPVTPPTTLAPPGERSDASHTETVSVRSGSEAPRVLVLTHDLGIGGAQLFLHTLLERLRLRGLWCAVVSHQDGPLRHEIEERGWPVLIAGDLDFGSPVGLEERSSRLQDWIREHDCNVALANTTVTFPEVAVAQRLRLPVVWAVHESYSREQFWLEFSSTRSPDPRLVESYDRALAAASRVVFVSKATKALYEDRIGESAGVVVRYGVDLEKVDAYRALRTKAEVRRELGINDETRLLLCLGIVTPLKGQIALAQAFAGSDVLRDRNVMLAFVGATSGPYVDGLVEYVSAVGDPRIRVVPLDGDSYRWHVGSDVLVSGSDNESMPRTMIEAMAFERPVAGPAVFGVPELVESGKNGFLCPPSDVRELRSMLERVGAVENAQLEEMGRQARQTVLKENDADDHAEFFELELRRLAGFEKAQHSDASSE